MQLFGRKRSDPMLAERCPQCHEPIPDGAVECKMCGVELSGLREAQSGTAPDPRNETGRHRRTA